MSIPSKKNRVLPPRSDKPTRWVLQLVSEATGLGQEMTLLALILIFLKGLPEEYDAVESILVGSGKLNDWSFVLSSLESEERSMQLRKQGKEKFSAHKANIRGCFTCGKQGHRAAVCFKNPNSPNYRGNGQRSAVHGLQ